MTGFDSKRSVAADKDALFEKFELAQPAQEQWKCVGPPCKCNASNAKQCCYAVFTTPSAVQPAQEPVSFPCCGYTDAIKWNQFNGVVQCHMCGQIYTASNAKQCFTAPPKREWVGLTDEEREQHRNDWHSNIHDKEFYAIEAKLKEKNT